MNRQEVREKFPDITDEQLEWLMASNGAAVKSAKDGLQAQLAEARAAAESLQAQVDEFNRQQQQNLTKEEQLEKALEEMRNKQAETQKGYNRMNAAQRFNGLGLSDEGLSTVLDMVVTDDADATDRAAESLASIIKGVSDASAAEARKSFQASTPKPQGSASTTGVTKEQFDAMSYSERLALFNESPETYEQLSAKE